MNHLCPVDGYGVFIYKNDTVRVNDSMVSSLLLSDKLNKRHDNVIRTIRKIIKSPEQKDLMKKCFVPCFYKNTQSKLQPAFLMNHYGLKLYLSALRNIPVGVTDIPGIGNIDVIYSYSRFENSFLDMLEKALNEIGMRGERQYRVFGGKYRIDFYIPDKKIAVEYDEEQHSWKNAKKKDCERQEEIEKHLGCIFIRCSYLDEDIVNVMKVLKHIMNN